MNLKKIETFFKKYKAPLSLAFVGAFLALVVFEFGQISKEFSLEKMQGYIGSYGLLDMVLIGVIGLVSVFPMVGYDLALFKFSGIKSPGKIKGPALAYAINSYNNSVGVVGTAYFSLRYFFMARK